MLRISDIILELEEIKAEHGDLIVMHQDDGGYEEELKYGLVCDVKDRDIGRMIDYEEYDACHNTDLTDSKEHQYVRESRLNWFNQEKNEEGKVRYYCGDNIEKVVILQ